MRRHVVGLFEVDRVDLVELDELLQVDRLRGRRDERFDLAGVDDDVATSGDLVPFDDLVGGTSTPVCLDTFW